MASAPLLVVDRLVVDYGPIRALRGVSISVDEGEIVTIVGPNGAGKSSLMGAIAGSVRGAGGSIVFAGRRISGERADAIVRQGVSLIPEGRHIFGRMTVLENLRLGATTQRDRGEIAASIEHVYGLFPVLQRYASAPAGKLSGGEQQQLAIGRALLAKPRFLLLDEPSLGLAPQMVDLVFGTIDRLRGEGTTILVVEQNAQRALESADRAYVLRHGEVTLEGPARGLSDSPAFEAAYFGHVGEDSKTRR